MSTLRASVTLIETNFSKKENTGVREQHVINATSTFYQVSILFLEH